jgi:hypothetical protein
VADFVDAPVQRVAVGDLRGFQAVQQQVHLRQHVGQRLGFLAVEGVALQGAALLGRFDLRGEVIEGLHQESAGAAGGVEHGLAQARVGHLHHEAHHGRGV